MKQVKNRLMSLSSKNNFVFNKDGSIGNRETYFYKHIKQLYLSNGAPWEEVNIFGIRNEAGQRADGFNDYIGVVIDKLVFLFNGTCDPGAYWTFVGGAAGDKKGVAHLCYGYHRNAYMVGIHRGYEALAQWGAPVTIWRDGNNNFRRDDEDIVQRGYFGINIHRASDIKEVTKIGRYSAGCQVIQNIMDFELFMDKIKSSNKFKQNPRSKFSYFLFPVDLFSRFNLNKNIELNTES